MGGSVQEISVQPRTADFGVLAKCCLESAFSHSLLESVPACSCCGRLSGLQHYCMLSDICCGVGFMTIVYQCCRGGGLNLDFHASGRFVHTLTDQTLNTNIYGPWLLFITVVVVVVIVVVYSVLFLCGFWRFVVVVVGFGFFNPVQKRRRRKISEQLDNQHCISSIK